ncbi:MAG: hypothetical protein Q4C66_00440 [Lachnospiraceae bacterium]|nr:hypothetical protein [Lachnospiraceae bacterium]
MSGWHQRTINEIGESLQAVKTVKEEAVIKNRNGEESEIVIINQEMAREEELRWLESGIHIIQIHITHGHMLRGILREN